MLGDAIVLPSYTRGRLPEVFWRGAVPWTDRDASYQYRLVIREHELYFTDPEVQATDLTVYNPDGRALGERLVYLDTVPLTP